ncbi:MAG: SpoIIE family protein phosphatase [Acidobacteria bacterium]|nr:SpoIIE family protein phosphatase [Acidobacteriota bacterium]
MRLRIPQRMSAGPRQGPLLPAPPPGMEPSPGAAELLLRSWPGRLFILSAALKLTTGVVGRAVDPPAVIELLGTGASIGLTVSVGCFVWRLFVLTKRRLLWRVRRKLILSYIFIGVVPALLIIGFFLLSANVISMNMSAYLFKDGYDDVVSDVKLTARTAALEIARQPAMATDALSRAQMAVGQRYASVAMAFVPAKVRTAQRGDADALGLALAGAWEHQSPPSAIPAWIPAEGFAGTTFVASDEPGEVQLVIRSVVPARGSAGAVGHVVADVPVDDHLLGKLRETTGVNALTPRFAAPRVGSGTSSLQALAQRAGANSVAFLDTYDWQTGKSNGATISMIFDVSELWKKISKAQSANITLRGESLGQAFLYTLALVALLFLIIQGVALLMGLTLARSITSSIHELFMGTERVREGDFTHRIKIQTKDQLGELAASFNQMTGSIEGLLLTAAEKKRMEEELRIARQIQMSLLPRGPHDVPGLGITALCVPAREVGGDYYDFFHLAGDRLGILIADVAGKGTSAALYMAELKGLVLALSQSHSSPRALLLEVNRIISENLDSRSFITMTYAVIDRRQATMTYCRAGHTPLVFMGGAGSSMGSGAQILTPNGMVVGLRFPGASEKFDELLEEARIELAVGDVIVFYTDGISEAMNPASDLFGEARLSTIIEQHGHLESGELRERILREIEAFVAGADQHDDMTMVLVKVGKTFQGSTKG